MLQQKLKYLFHTKLFSAIWKKANMTSRPLVNFAKLANTSIAYPQENSCWANFTLLNESPFVLLLFVLNTTCQSYCLKQPKALSFDLRHMRFAGSKAGVRFKMEGIRKQGQHVTASFLSCRLKFIHFSPFLPACWKHLYARVAERSHLHTKGYDPDCMLYCTICHVHSSYCSVMPLPLQPFTSYNRVRLVSRTEVLD